MRAFCQFTVEEVLGDAARFHMPVVKKGKHAVYAGLMRGE